MSERSRRYWNPVGIAFTSVFAFGGLTFAAVAAAAAGLLPAPGGADGPVGGFGPVGAGLLAVAFLVLASRCNLWVDLDEREVRVQGPLRRVRLPRDSALRAGYEFRTRPTGLRLSHDRRSVVVYPRPRGAEALLHGLGRSA